MRKVHFIAIGGQGMSAIARILLSRGYEVSGSDLKLSEITCELERLGARIHQGHRAENLGDPDLVVVSSAIRPDNPELQEARRKGIPVVHRMDMLLQAVDGKYLVAVAGAHGKTTTTAMIAWILVHARRDPTFLIGGELPGLGNSRPGAGPHAVFETDESDGSFLKVHADVAVATNIDDDHLDYWGSIDQLEQAFYRFLGNVRAGGHRIVCSDDPRLAAWADRCGNATTYAIRTSAHWEARDISREGWGSAWWLLRNGQRICSVRLSVPGIHNVQNALAALAASCACGLELEEAVSSIATFPGVRRRLQRIAEVSGVIMLDDFAHHPREISATLETVRSNLPGRRMVVVFQPHRYSRTRLLKRELAEALARADALILTSIYPGPGEAEEPGVSTELLEQELRDLGYGSVYLIPDMERIPEFLSSRLQPGDVLITVGAGDIWKIHQPLRENLEARRE